MPARKLDPKLEATGREVRIATAASPDCQTANLDFDALDVRSWHRAITTSQAEIGRLKGSKGRQIGRARWTEAEEGGRNGE